LLTYPEASGDRQNKARKSLRNYYNHLFGIKGGGNLRDFTRFARRHCPWPYLPSYVLLGSLRRIGRLFSAEERRRIGFKPYPTENTAPILGNKPGILAAAINRKGFKTLSPLGLLYLYCDPY
jgi:hypothetical protein